MYVILFIIIILIIFLCFINKKINKEFIKGQYLMTQMFKKFDNICRQNGIEYWCIGGTLIGTIRHRGWIPWDGDIDVGMLENDYKKFRSVIKNHIPSNWVFEHKPINKPCSKIRLLDSHYISSEDSYHWDDDDGLQLDIFVYKNRENIISGLFKPHAICGEGDISSRPYKDIFPLKELFFEDIRVYIPNKYKEISKNAWGDYPPPFPSLEKRVCHEGDIRCNHITKRMEKKYKGKKGIITENGKILFHK
jgi:phosphorylcholine metabolism protein LicD